MKEHTNMIPAIEAGMDFLASQRTLAETRPIIPRYPWVLLRVLPREQTLKSGIHVPGAAQNKTVHEGIVMATWKPITFPFQMKRVEKTDQAVTYEPREEADGTVRTSALKPGDHVLYPHWAGFPLEGLAADKYRVVKEEGWKESTDGGIFAVLDRDGESFDDVVDRIAGQVKTKVASMRTLEKITTDLEVSVRDALYSVLGNYIVIDGDRTSTTLSGA